MEPKILVSACLAGQKCRYNASHALNPDLMNRLQGEKVVTCCPEIMAGLPTPRPSCNIKNGGGLDVLEGRAQVVGVDGKDYTKEFVNGARMVLKRVLDEGINTAFLKQNSPSCGCGKIYSPDGAKIIDGDGVTAALLKQNGIKIESL